MARRQAPPRPGDVATPAPSGVPDRKLFPPEDPEPLHKLRADRLALDKMIGILESKNQWFEQRLIGPALLFGAGCGVTLLGIVVISVFPNMAVGGLIFGSPAVWLVVGALVAVVGFGLVVGGGVWHAPIHKKQRPVRENLAELKARRKHLLRLMARQTARGDASTLHLPAVASPRLRVAF